MDEGSSLKRNFKNTLKLKIQYVITYRVQLKQNWDRFLALTIPVRIIETNRWRKKERYEKQSHGKQKKIEKIKEECNALKDQ